MGWQNLIISCQNFDPHLLSDFLVAKGALAVSIINTNPDSREKDKWFDDPNRPDFIDRDTAEVAAIFPQNSPIDELIEAVRNNFSMVDLPLYRVETLPDQDWVSSTQKLSTAQKISDRIWIVPTWEAVKEEKAVNIRLDPGLAFGSGTHPTTRLCLKWLENNVSGGDCVLDYGCGSGILAIAALKLGAEECIGIDIDQQALESTYNNARINQVKIKTFLPEDEPPRQYNSIIANILANPLMELAELFATRLKVNGTIALSGILDSQIEAVQQAYGRHFSNMKVEKEEGWALISAKLS